MRMDVGIMRREEEKEEEEERMKGGNHVDMSGLSLDAISNPSSFNPALITKLDLSNNNLQNIPESLTARLLNVVVLDVHSNQLRLLPNSIGCLSKLKLLNVSGNLLDSLPKTIEDCKGLEELNANFNKLTKLPETIGFELLKLRKLSVNSNKLAYLPYSTSHMTSLRVLDARMNCLRSLPEGLENLISLQVLNVSQNFQFLQALPSSVGMLLSLVELDVSYNRITHLPNSIACLANLQKLQVEGNPIVSPPMEVVEQSVEAVRIYLTDRMNGTTSGSAASPRKKPWFKKLVKCGTFNGAAGSTSTSTINYSSRGGIMDEHDGFLLSDYRSINGLTSPRYMGRFSPRRLFSPRRASCSSPRH